MFSSLPEVDFVYPSPTISQEATPTHSLANSNSKFQPPPPSYYHPIKEAPSPYVVSTPSPDSVEVYTKEDSGDKALEDAFSGVDLELAQSSQENSPNDIISTITPSVPPYNPNYTPIYPNSNSGFPWVYNPGAVAALPGYVSVGNGDQNSEVGSKRMRPMYEPLNFRSDLLQSQPNYTLSDVNLRGNSLIYPKMISSDTLPSQFPLDHINFSKDELLSLNSDQFEEHVRTVSSVRTLTESEKNAIKRQRRLIKNRESAQASRQRKKDYVGDLEKKVDDLMAGIGKLKEIYSSAVTENYQLRNEVEFLSQLVHRIQVY
jgi:hypothetical protein